MEEIVYPRPMIIFQVNLTPPGNEAMGTITNQTMQGTNSPDNIVDLPNQTLIDTLKAYRPYSRSTTSPSIKILSVLTTVPNNLKHGQYIFLFGSQALQAKKLYCNAASGGQAIVKTMDIVYEGEPPANDSELF